MSNSARKLRRRAQYDRQPLCPRCGQPMKWRKPKRTGQASRDHRWTCPVCTWEIRPKTPGDDPG